MTNPYDVYEKSTYQKVSQMRGWDSGGDFAVSFGCESCFTSETQSLCVAQSKSVPNIVVIMRIFREKILGDKMTQQIFPDLQYFSVEKDAFLGKIRKEVFNELPNVK